jgi:hypothetical protein
MKRIKRSDKITFGTNHPDGTGGGYWQKIYVEGEQCGVLVTRVTSLLKPIRETYQFGAFAKCVPDTIPCMESEDEGWVFVQASSLLDFIIYRNIVSTLEEKYGTHF